MKNIKIIYFFILLFLFFIISVVIIGNINSKYNDVDKDLIISVGEGKVKLELLNGKYDLNGNLLTNDNNILAPGMGRMINFSIDCDDSYLYDNLDVIIDDSNLSNEIKDNKNIKWKFDDGKFLNWDEFVINLENSLENFNEDVIHNISWKWDLDSSYNSDEVVKKILSDDNICDELYIEVIEKK